MTATAPDGLLAPSTVALLIIWCFIAGFSEKLVPSLLAKTEAGTEAQPVESSGGMQGYRPTEHGRAPGKHRAQAANAVVP